jgi:hypothetical protein
MCELTFNTAGERHDMCESAFRPRGHLDRLTAFTGSLKSKYI